VAQVQTLDAAAVQGYSAISVVPFIQLMPVSLQYNDPKMIRASKIVVQVSSIILAVDVLWIILGFLQPDAWDDACKQQDAAFAAFSEQGLVIAQSDQCTDDAKRRRMMSGLFSAVLSLGWALGIYTCAIQGVKQKNSKCCCCGCLDWYCGCTVVMTVIWILFFILVFAAALVTSLHPENFEPNWAWIVILGLIALAEIILSITAIFNAYQLIQSLRAPSVVVQQNVAQPQMVQPQMVQPPMQPPQMVQPQMQPVLVTAQPVPA
jgi:hypothetical protein